MQLKPSEFSDEDTIDQVLKCCKEASDHKAEVVCLPEHWLLKSVDIFDKSISALCSTASKNRIHIISGSNYEKVENKIFINSVVIDPNGEIVARQSKIHLFRNENKIAFPGNDYTIFEIKDYKAGIMICYDAAFPEVARILTLKGADVIFVPSRIRKEGIKAWHLYLKARTLENRVYTVGVNIANPPEYPGGSIILMPEKDSDSEIDVVNPKILKIGDTKPQLIVTDLDLSVARNLRAERLKDRRPETYSYITKY